MSAIGPRDNMSLQQVLGSTPTTPTASSVDTATASVAAGIFGRPADLPGSVPAPRSDLPALVRERTISSTMARAAGPELPSVPSRQAEAQAKLGQAADKLKEARDAGVSLAEKGFFKKLINVATSIAAVAVAAVLTAATGGIALPMLALACVNLAVNVGDSVCAFRNLRNMQALARGEEPPYKLPGGTSCIKNLVHNLATAAGAGNETAGQVATVIGGFVQVGLAVGAFVSGQAAGALPLAHKIVNIVSSGLKALMAGSTAVTTGFIEAGAPGVPGHTGEAMRRAVMAGQEALAMSPDIVGADAGQQRVLEIVRDQQGQPDGPRARAERLVVDAVKNYGDAKVNAGLAIAGFAGMGKALMGI